MSPEHRYGRPNLQVILLAILITGLKNRMPKNFNLLVINLKK